MSAHCTSEGSNSLAPTGKEVRLIGGLRNFNEPLCVFAPMKEAVQPTGGQPFGSHPIG